MSVTLVGASASPNVNDVVATIDVPVGVLAGDYMLAFVATDDQTTIDVVFCAGWVLEGIFGGGDFDGDFQATVNPVNYIRPFVAPNDPATMQNTRLTDAPIYVFSRVADGTETPSYTFDTSNEGDILCGLMLVYRGAGPTKPIAHLVAGDARALLGDYQVSTPPTFPHVLTATSPVVGALQIPANGIAIFVATNPLFGPYVGAGALALRASFDHEGDASARALFAWDIPCPPGGLAAQTASVPDGGIYSHTVALVVLGEDPSLTAEIAPTGIPSAAAFGSPGVRHRLAPAGIASGGAFGTPNLGMTRAVVAAVVVPDERVIVPWDETTGFGLLQPLVRDEKSDFASSGGRRLVKSRVEQILGTQCEGGESQGELEWRTSFGSRLYQLRHVNNDAISHAMAYHYVVEALQRWEPQIQVTAVSITKEDVVPGRSAAMVIRVGFDVIPLNENPSQVLRGNEAVVRV